MEWSFEESNAYAAAIARRVRVLRKRRGWSQEHIADLMVKRGHRVDRSIVANVEAGRTVSLSIDRALSLAAIFETPLDRLMRPSGCHACDGDPPVGFRCLVCGAERAIDQPDEEGGQPQEDSEASLGASEEF